MGPRISGARRSACRALEDTRQGLHIEVQAVTHPSRVHLDIETDDIEAEVRRLEALGAKRVQMIRTWWVMEAPTGQRFCVIRAASKDFDLKSSHWP
jgi:Glyoxalase-like domain